MGSLTWHVALGFLQWSLWVQQYAQTPHPHLSPPSQRGGSAVDRVPLPSGGVIVIVDDAKKALDRMDVKGILISPERYQELINKAKEADARAPASAEESLVDTCVLTGRMVGEHIELRAELTFKTQAANALVRVGFKEAKLTRAVIHELKGTTSSPSPSSSGAEARDDGGETPVWATDTSSRTVRVAKAQTYRLVLDMRIKIQRRENERSVLVDLPGAAITKLDLRLPERVRQAFVKGSGAVPIEHLPPLSPPSPGGVAGGSRLHADALGTLSQLDLTWEAGMDSAQPAPPEAEVEGELRVLLDDDVTETEARLSVQAVRGTTSVLRFALGDPQRTKVSVLQVEEESTPSSPPLAKGGTRAGARPQPERSERVEPEYDAKTQILTIKLNRPLTPADRSLRLRIRMRQERPVTAGPTPASPPLAKGGTRGGAVTPIGRMELREPAAQVQKGTIGIWAATGLRVDFPTATTSALDPIEPPAQAVEARTPVGAFRYYRQPVVLEAQVQVRQPVVAVTAEHDVRFGQQQLLLTSQFSMDVQRSGVQELELHWPKELQPGRWQPANLLDTLDPQASESTVRLRLIRQQRGRFTLTVESTLPIGSATSATLVLPVMRQARYKAGSGEAVPVASGAGIVRLAVPRDLDVRLRAESIGVLQRDETGSAERLLPRPTARFSLDPNPERPAQLALSWQPRSLDVTNHIDGFVTRQELYVRQTLQFRFDNPLPSQVWLRVPADLGDAFRLQLVATTKDSKPVAQPVNFNDRRSGPDGTSERAVSIPGNLTDGCRLIAEYRILLGTPPGPIAHSPTGGQGKDEGLPIPFIEPVHAIRDGTHASFWSTSNISIRQVENSGWEIAPFHGSESVNQLSVKQSPDSLIHLSTNSWPNLQLRRVRGSMPLRVTWRTAAESSRAGIDLVAERVLVQSTPLGQGRWWFRARFWLSRIRCDQFQVLLPGSSRSILVEQVILGGNEVPLQRVEQSVGEDGSEQVRINVPVKPVLLAQPAILEVRFQWHPGQRRGAIPGWVELPAPDLGLGISDFAFSNPQSEIPNPKSAGGVRIGRVRWSVELPNSRLPVFYTSGYTAEQTWQWFGWLRAPQAERQGSNLEHWLAGDDAAPNSDVAEPLASPSAQDGDQGGVRPAFGFTQLGSLESLSIIYVPERAWLLLCSIVVLIPGVLMSCFPPRFGVFWLAVIVLGLTAIGLTQPSVFLAFVYGAQPGLVVLAALALLFWFRQQRWRRRVILLPGFTRVKAGSSLQPLAPLPPLSKGGTRGSSALRVAPREPTTVDAPNPDDRKL